MSHRDFAKTLVAGRERNDYTQKQAAEMLAVSKRSLENWEQERAMQTQRLPLSQRSGIFHAHEHAR